VAASGACPVPPSDRESIREDLNDALQSGGELHEAFPPTSAPCCTTSCGLREVRVEDVMVPRADVEAVDQTTTLGRLLEIFEESGRSRMPVYAENLDDPRGMIHIRDLLAWITKQARPSASPPPRALRRARSSTRSMRSSCRASI
jgi:CBS domain containing-hemolysin-like protein